MRALKLSAVTASAHPKNNWRIYFRGEYGAGSLNYPLFEGHPYSSGPADSFKRLMFRSGSHDNFFWLANSSTPPSGGRRSDANYMRNRWINDPELSHGPQRLARALRPNVRERPLSRGRYQIIEFPNDDFQASYFGGRAEDHHFTNGRE